MHLNKILEQIKRHQSPTEAIDKLATALEKHEGSLLEKGFTILKSELAANMYEAINGPHFDEEHAHYAVVWGGWGGNGFGRGNQAETNSDFARLAAMGNQNNNTDLLMQAINGNKDAINTLSTNLNCDVKSIDNALCSIQNAIGKVGGEVGFSAERVINAVNAGDCNVIKAISDCCCTTQRSIDSVNLNLTQMNADNRLSICQQTNTLQNAITSGFNTLSCDGEQRKLSVSEDKTMMTDSSIGLTIATEKSQIVNMVRQSLDDCRIKKESLSKIDEEMRRCEDILKILNVNSDITTNVTKDFKELDDLKAEVKELKQLLQNVSAVRPEVIKNTPPNSTEDKKVEPEGEIKKEI